MDNSTNTSLNVTSTLSGPGFLVFNVVMLLGVVLPVIVANVVILVVLALESSIAKAIRLVLGSIIVACILTALGLAMYHIAGIILNRSPVNNPPTTPCTITVFLIAFGGAARLVFVSAFAVVVCIIVKRGESTRLTSLVAIIPAVAVLWVFCFLGTSPPLSQVVVHTAYWRRISCGMLPMEVHSYIFTILYVLVFGLAAVLVTVVLLVIICFIKWSTLSHATLENTLVKFSFFLLLCDGVSIVGQIVPILIDALPTSEVLIYTAYTILDLFLIPTPISVPIFFKPIRKRLWGWLCCCMPCKGMWHTQDSNCK